ncbi:MAG TPA: RagB/SusD family nutrient uptake outer membrane protein [Chitinophagaceae bacterium]
MRKVNLIFIVASMLVSNGCTKLEEKFLGDTTQGTLASGNSAILLQSLYSSLYSVFTYHLTVWPLQELCTDEAIFPTRGIDWDDNGIWRSLHQHTWPSNHDVITECFNKLNGISYAATDLLRYNPSGKEQAEARFIRAWVMYLLLDLYDQVPYREKGESLTNPSRVRKDTSALNYIIGEINAVQTNLDVGPPHKANKYAAKMLLMKCYLNKAIYENRTNPSFSPTDMNIVIRLADSIINSNNFSFSTTYFDNFAPDNTNSTNVKENIFALLSEPGSNPNSLMWFAWTIPLHYHQYGFNGWATLSDFYNKFELNDKRRGIVYNTPNSPPNPSGQINVGFLVGQQYDYLSGDPLKDRTGIPLIYTPEVSNIERFSNREVTGIRPIKYFPDWGPNYYSPNNDFVLFRFSDVLLMKAEAIARGGTGTYAGIYGNTALLIVNALRTHSSRGASALSSLTPDSIYNERGRELWFEGWRRQDMIRFGKFLGRFQEKDYISDPKYLIYPIPDEQLAVNPNLVQNPGY